MSFSISASDPKRIGPLTPLSASAPPEQTRDTSQFKQDISDLMSGACRHEGFDAFSAKAVKMIMKQVPSLEQKKTAFCEAHASKITAIKEKGWSALKGDMQERMEAKDSSGGVSFAEFRSQAVDLVIDICQQTLSEMGYRDVGEHSAIGTPGYNSDIDTVFITFGKDVPEEIQITEKLLFDAVWNGIFEGLSGFQVDTESYLNHPAVTYKTENHLDRPSGKEFFSRLELTLSTIQMRRAYGDDKEGWDVYKKNLLERAEDFGDYKGVLEEILTDVEVFETIVEEGIQQQVVRENGGVSEGEVSGEREGVPSRNLEEWTPEELAARCKDIMMRVPHAYDKAKMSYKMAALVALSREMDADKGELKKLEETLVNPSPLHPRSQAEENQRELLKLRIAARSALRNCFFDESYLTQGAFNNVCMTKGGQSHQRQIEQHITGVRSEEETHGISTPVQKKFLEIYFPKTTSSGLTVLQEHCILKFIVGSEQPTKKQARSTQIFASRLYPVSVSSFDPKISVEVTSQGSASSQQENLSMYIGKYAHKEKEADAQKALIYASKYSERVMASTTNLIGFLENKKPDLPGIKSLKIKVQRLDFLTKELEKCKRKKTLNRTATLSMLQEELEKTPPKVSLSTSQLGVLKISAFKKGASVGKLLIPKRLQEVIQQRVQKERARTLEKDIMMCIRLSEIDDVLRDNDNILLPEARVKLASTYLMDRGYGVSSAVEKILAVRCGTPISGADSESIRQDLLSSGEKIFLHDSRLETLEYIKKINGEIEDCATRVYNLSIRHGVIPQPVGDGSKGGSLSGLSLSGLWQSAMEMSRVRGDDELL